MAKKICPACNSKINENEEICPKCGYFFSNNYSGVDSEGRPYDFYQETNHQNHYDGENIKINKKTGNIKSDYVVKTLLSRDRELPQSFTDEELLKTIDNIYGGSFIALLFGFGIPFFIGFICELFDDISDIEDILVCLVITIIIMIIVFIASGKTRRQLKKSKKYLKNGDYVGFVEYVDDVTIKDVKNKNYNLLYAGTIIAYFKLSDKITAEKFLNKALTISADPIFVDMPLFEVIFKGLGKEEDIATYFGEEIDEEDIEELNQDKK